MKTDNKVSDKCCSYVAQISTPQTGCCSSSEKDVDAWGPPYMVCRLLQAPTPSDELNAENKRLHAFLFDEAIDEHSNRLRNVVVELHAIEVLLLELEDRTRLVRVIQCPNAVAEVLEASPELSLSVSPLDRILEAMITATFRYTQKARRISESITLSPTPVARPTCVGLDAIPFTSLCRLDTLSTWITELELSVAYLREDLCPVTYCMKESTPDVAQEIPEASTVDMKLSTIETHLTKIRGMLRHLINDLTI